MYSFVPHSPRLNLGFVGVVVTQRICSRGEIVVVKLERKRPLLKEP